MAMRPTDGPFTPAQLDQFRQDEALLQRIQAQIDAGCRCGLDMRSEQALCDALKERVRLLLNEFAQRKPSR